MNSGGAPAGTGAGATPARGGAGATGAVGGGSGGGRVGSAGTTRASRGCWAAALGCIERACRQQRRSGAGWRLVGLPAVPARDRRGRMRRGCAGRRVEIGRDALRLGDDRIVVSGPGGRFSLSAGWRASRSERDPGSTSAANAAAITAANAPTRRVRNIAARMRSASAGTASRAGGRGAGARVGGLWSPPGTSKAVVARDG